MAGTRGRRLLDHFDDFIPSLTNQHVHTGKSKIFTAQRERPLARTQQECQKSAQQAREGPLLKAQVVTLCWCARNSGKPPPWKRVQIAIFTHQVKPDHRACVVAGTTHKTNSMWENLPEPDGPSRWVLPTAGLCGRALDVPRRQSPNRRRGPHAGRGKVKWRNHSRNWPPSPLFSCSVLSFKNIITPCAARWADTRLHFSWILFCWQHVFWQKLSCSTSLSIPGLERIEVHFLRPLHVEHVNRVGTVTRATILLH